MAPRVQKVLFVLFLVDNRGYKKQ